MFNLSLIFQLWKKYMLITLIGLLKLWNCFKQRSLLNFKAPITIWEIIKKLSKWFLKYLILDLRTLIQLISRCIWRTQGLSRWTWCLVLMKITGWVLYRWVTLLVLIITDWLFLLFLQDNTKNYIFSFSLT